MRMATSAFSSARGWAAGAEVPAASAGAAEVQAITAARASAAIRFFSIVSLLTKADASGYAPAFILQESPAQVTDGITGAGFPSPARPRSGAGGLGPRGGVLHGQPWAAISALRASAVAQSFAF